MKISLRYLFLKRRLQRYIRYIVLYILIVDCNFFEFKIRVFKIFSEQPSFLYRYTSKKVKETYSVLRLFFFKLYISYQLLYYSRVTFFITATTSKLRVNKAQKSFSPFEFI